MAKASQLTEQAAASRDLAKRAKRARRLAGTFVDGPDKDRLLRYAEELEEKAAGLEAKASHDEAESPAQPSVTHEQQQVQQQQEAQEPAPDSSEPKTKA